MLKKGSVAAGSKEAVDAAFHALTEGGNAVDAAVSAVFASMTSEFSLTGVAGGGAMTLSINGEQPLTIDFFVDAIPKEQNSTVEFVEKVVDFGDATQTFRIGKGSIAVPGTLQGLLYAQKKFGNLPLEVVLEPGINYARSGVRLNRAQAYIFKLLEPIFSHDSKNNIILFKDKNILQEGDLFKNEIFSDFLFELSREGMPFYLNDGLEIIDRFLKKDALFTGEEILSYDVLERECVSTQIGEYNFFSNPSPSFGGSLIAFSLDLINNLSHKRLSNDLLVKIFQATENVRAYIQGNKSSIGAVQSSDMIARGLEIVNNFSNSSIKDTNINGFGSTTHVSVIDRNHSCVSVTTTNGEGCGYIIPELGIMMNNMMGEEDLNTNGFHTYLRRQRLATMMAPSIVFKDRRPFLVLGSGGSNRLRSAIIQVMINYCFKEMSLEESVSLERLYVEAGTLFTEPGIKLVGDAMKMYSQSLFNGRNLFFGGVNAAALDEAFGDSRREGYAVCL